jgi:hypothetical protein
MQILKHGQQRAAARQADSAVRARVSEMLLDIESHGIDAVRRYRRPAGRLRARTLSRPTTDPNDHTGNVAAPG